MAWLTDKELFEDFFLEKDDLDTIVDNGYDIITRAETFLQENPIPDDAYTTRVCEHMIESPVGKRKKFSKMLSVGHTQWIKTLDFISKFSDTGYLNICNIRLVSKKNGRYLINPARCYIFEVKTPKGLLYVSPGITGPEAEDRTFVNIFTSHFLDRFFERVYGAPNRTTRGRVELLFNFLKETSKYPSMSVMGNSARCICKDGIGIGHYFEVPNRSYLFMQTFVSRKMLTKKQLAVLDRNILYTAQGMEVPKQLVQDDMIN